MTSMTNRASLAGGALFPALALVLALALGLSLAARAADGAGGADDAGGADSVLTRGDILRVLPFDDRLLMVEISGADLRQALENGVSNVGEKSRRFLQVSGLSFTFDPGGAPGGAKGRRVSKVTLGGADLDDEKTYTAALNNYLLRGGGGFDVFKQAKVLIGPDGGRQINLTVMDYIARKKEIAPRVDGRITVK